MLTTKRFISICRHTVDPLYLFCPPASPNPLPSGSLVLVAQLFSCDPMNCSHQTPLSLGFLGKNTGVGCHFLLQGTFLTQGSNPGLPHCRQVLYHLSHQGIHSLYLCVWFVYLFYFLFAFIFQIEMKS